MAQAGYTPIQLYFSTTASATPSAGNLANGELAINITDGRLFYKDNGGTVRVLAGTGGSGVVAGSNTQVQFNNNGVFGASSGLTWDGTNLTASQLRSSGLTSGRVTYATTGGLLTDSPNLTFNGTRLTAADFADSGLTATRVVYSTTGGALVDSANLTFDGTNLTLGGGTANGVAYLNGSKVLTTGSALTFDGSKVAIATAGNDQLTWATGGKTGYLYVDSAGVAIGDTALLSGNNTYYNKTSNYIANYINGSEQMRLNSTGLGIGTSSPNYRADILASNFRGLRVQSSGDDAIITMGSQIASSQYWSIAATSNTSGQGANNFIIETTDSNAGGTVTPRLTISSAGNVGIGTSSPTVYGSYRTLEVRGTGGGLLQLGTGATTAAYLFQDGTNAGFNNIANGVITFGTNNTERARITSGGDFLIGQTSGNNARFSVSVGAVNSIESKSSSTGMTHLLVSASISNAGGSDALGVYDNSGISARITTNGFYQSRPNSYGGTSDIKLKENVVDATPKLSDIMSVRIRNYNYKDEPGVKQIGVIAQEIEQVFPGLVYETPDRDVEGNDLGTTTKSVKYSVFVPMLIKAMQEQQAIIEQLKADVAALKGA